MNYESYIKTSQCEVLRGNLANGRPLAFRRSPGRDWELQHVVPACFGDRAYMTWRPVDFYQRTLIRRLLAMRAAAAAGAAPKC
jgi:hypothetical protein